MRGASVRSIAASEGLWPGRPAAIAAVCLLYICAGAAGAAEPVGPNLVRNQGFEEGAAGWRLPAAYDVAPGAGRQGGAALHVVRKDPAVYELASQAVDCRPGRRYRFAAWVKTRGVAGQDSGATLCMEWSGAAGWIGGAYPDGIRGDAGWTRIVGTTPPIPADATRLSLTLYLRKGMTGEAWFDDVEACEFWGRPMEAYLSAPAYRGLIFADEQRGPVRVRVELAPVVLGRAWRDAGGYEGIDPPVVLCRLRSGDRTVAEKRIAAPAARTLDVEFDGASLPVGDYCVDVTLLAAGAEAAAERLAGTVLPAGRRPRVYVDRLRRTIVDGKPFFPLGFYLGDIQEADIQVLAQAGFNCVMPYAFSGMGLDRAAQQLALAERHGLRVIYSVKDLYPGTKHFPKQSLDGRADADAMVAAAVERFRSHPNVLGWYVNDELPATMRETLEARQRLMRRLDPDHPTWAVLFQVGELSEYRHTCDILGSDPYPVPDKPVTMAGDWARLTRDATGGAAAVWQVPQAFAWTNYGRKSKDPGRDRAPTLGEVRTMTYLALVGGASGLIYYSFYDLRKDPLGFEARWKDLARVGREVQALMPALLAADAPPPQVTVSGPRWAARRDGRRVWVLVTNPEARAVAMRLAVPTGVSEVRTLEGRAAAVRDAAVAEDLPPLACETFIFDLPGQAAGARP